jgi:hypothetical protein
MRPEERAYYRAFLRAFPKVLLVFFVMLAVALALNLGAAAFSLGSTAAVTFLFFWMTRSDYRDMREASRQRGAAERERRHRRQ